MSLSVLSPLRLESPWNPSFTCEKEKRHADSMPILRASRTHYAGPDQHDKLRQAVEIITDWLVRHDFAGAA
jgi:hypothetical protein